MVKDTNIFTQMQVDSQQRLKLQEIDEQQLSGLGKALLIL